MSLPANISIGTGSDRLIGEREERLADARRILSYGVPFLDDALGGIYPHDLIIFGAMPGAGKTAMASLIAQNLISLGKRVHLMALEAELREIERRIKFRYVAEEYRRQRGSGARILRYGDWLAGRLDRDLASLERQLEPMLLDAMANLVTVYRQASGFTVADLEAVVRHIEGNTDLLIIDHLHYIDSDDENENRAMRDVVKRIRDVSLMLGRPVLLVCHLRKRDRYRPTLVPEIGDVHGSSEIVKIGTQVIVMAADPTIGDQPHLRGTYVQVVKDRRDGYKPEIARMVFNMRTQTYEPEYTLGRANAKQEFDVLGPGQHPYWEGSSMRRAA